MKPRGTWQGMWTIARLNWPFYLTASLVLASSVIAFARLGSPIADLALGTAAAGAFYFLTVSLGVSHWVYDRSDLYRWGWLDRALAGDRPASAIFCHAGFDEASVALRDRLEVREWTVLDHHDPGRMTEASIRRARRLFPPTATTRAAPHDRWPLADHCAELVVGLLAIHELRSLGERTAWFSEARRCLKPGGRVVLVEHTRDFANFLAFGPGFMHFHTVGNWRKCWRQAGFDETRQFRVTPWIRVFTLTKND